MTRTTHKRHQKQPLTTANDFACYSHKHTDEQFSAWPMKQLWQKQDIKQHAMLDFLYRARRGGLIEKEKAYERIENELANAENNASFFTRRYGKKRYHCWNRTCPCCGEEREHSNHVLHSCRATKAKHMSTLRQEVIVDLRNRSSTTLRHTPHSINCQRGLLAEMTLSHQTYSQVTSAYSKSPTTIPND